jgi:CRISPR-associated endonuclease/helicase Cas3
MGRASIMIGGGVGGLRDRNGTRAYKNVGPSQAYHPMPLPSSSEKANFEAAFLAITGHRPYPWQGRLYLEWFAQGRIPPSIILPTGTGKTRIMTLWLLAVSGGAPIPRRLVWVVDRRVVVDQATAEAESLRDRLSSPGLEGVRSGLCRLSVSGVDGEPPLAISTLRGAFEDNGEWCADPSRPAIVIGTVDMVGSRLLFSGYGDSRYWLPFHAGLLGTDALVVLDEAHLSRPFEGLLREIERLQAAANGGLPPLRFLPISATLRSDGAFSLAPEDLETPGLLSSILQAPKHLEWESAPGVPLPADEFRRKVVESALRYQNERARILVYLDRLDDLDPVRRELSRRFPGRVVTLTGTVRGFERDRLVTDPVFARFLRPADTGSGVVYLLCTSAGEVGIDLYADHLVCDLVPADRMIQRFGRVNRAGTSTATIHVHPRRTDPPRRVKAGRVHHSGVGGETALENTEEYLRGLSTASPATLDRDPPPRSAYSPTPPYPPLRGWLLDAWSLTSSRHVDLPVASWLRGLDPDSPDVYFAWREEVPAMANPEALDPEDVEAILVEFRLLPRELLRQDLVRARKFLTALAERRGEDGVLVISPRGELQFRGPLHDLVARLEEHPLSYRTVLLPTTSGGLDAGGVADATERASVSDVSSGRSSGSAPAGDRAKAVLTETDDGWATRGLDGGPALMASTREEALHALRTDRGLTRCVTFPLRARSDGELRQELVYLRARGEPGSRADHGEMRLTDHLEATGLEIERLTGKLALSERLTSMLAAAARAHDLGKARTVWQDFAGNAGGGPAMAKSPRYGSPRALGGYRHELGSLVDLRGRADPLALHLVASHHGYGRPGFPDRAVDRENRIVSREQSLLQLHRFVALQRQHGWWGLAYLEALLKCADARASG